MSIVAFIISFVLLIITFINIRKKGNKSFNPMILFFGLWSFILFLSMLQLYNIQKPSNEAYFLIILMLVFFFLGSITNLEKVKLKILGVFKKTNKTNVEEIEVSNGNGVNITKVGKWIFYCLSILLIIFTLIDCVIVVKGLIDGIPMWQIRRWGMEVAGSTNNPLMARRTFLEESFRSIILTPFATLIPPIAAYMLFNSDSKKEKVKFLMISIIVLLLSSIAGGGGRLGFIYYFGCFLLAFLIAIKKNKISDEFKKKYRRIVFAIFVIGVTIVAVYTVFRTSNFFKQIYTYFALPPTLLSIWLPEIKEVEHTYGLVSFFGLHSYFFRVLDTIGLDFLVPNIYNISYNHILNAEIFKNTGYGVGNAFVTPIYYFMIDGGYIFVCIASYLFGFIVSALYNKFEKNINMKSYIIYALIMYGIFLTFIRIQTCIPSYIISFILVYFIFNTKANNFIIKKYKQIIGEKHTKGKEIK